MITKKKILFVSVVAIIVVVILFGFLDKEKDGPKSDVYSSHPDRLLDPQLLYFSSSWSGMCRNDQGQEGGCFDEIYLYSSGKYLKEIGWTIGDKKDTSSYAKQFTEKDVAKIEKMINEANPTKESCPSEMIVDAGWDYQVRLTGERRQFHNPPDNCRDAFENIKESIEIIAKERPDITDSSELGEVVGQLGSHTCLSLFNVDRNNLAPEEKEVLKLDYLQTFWGGAFSGKITNFTPGQNKKLAALINELMKEGKVPTYKHLEADVCLYKQDLFNPKDGAILNYYIEHRYCTNSCHTGKYDLEVNLEPNGYFVGYRQEIER